MTALIYKPVLFCYILFGMLLPKPPVKALHPVHVSTTNIEYNKQDSKLEVICTIFTDDFEAALAKQYHGKMDLTKPEMHEAMDALVKKYVIANLQLKTGAAPLTLNYLGYEINKD